jgi:predicted GNAT family N-acyltransferase
LKNRTDAISIEQVTWQDAQQDLRHIRTRVFIVEQHVPPELEWDEHDADCIHLLAHNRDGRAVGTARILSDGHIGRMAVLHEWRGQGIGSALLQALIDIAQRQSLKKVFLYAQTTAIGFYEQHHFRVISDEFMDAGIPHREMELNLEDNS